MLVLRHREDTGKGKAEENQKKTESKRRKEQ
jgi:hypothetical protein